MIDAVQFNTMLSSAVLQSVQDMMENILQVISVNENPVIQQISSLSDLTP